MKYDEEYNSYRFSELELLYIINSLDFYQKYGPIENEEVREYLRQLSKNLLEIIES